MDETQTQQQLQIQPQPSAARGLFPFLLGLIIGGALVAGLGGVTRPAARLDPSQATRAPLTAEEIREAARQGAATAIAEIPSVPVEQSNEPQAAQEQAAAGPQQQPIFNVSARPANSLGADTAPITVIEYSDFECGYCRRFYDTTFKQVIDEYVKKGKVKVSYKHYPFLADSSLPKAHVAECAAEQGKFWQMHDVLFSGQIGRGTADEIAAQATELSGSLGMDATRFGECMKSDAVRQRIAADAQEAQQVGVRGTPSFLINGKPLVGAQPFAAFSLAIEQAASRQ
jgi:protein-disulfide isomerase